MRKLPHRELIAFVVGAATVLVALAVAFRTAPGVILALPLRTSMTVNCRQASGRSSIERAVNCPRMGCWYSMVLC